MKAQRRSATSVAHLLIINASVYAKERERNIVNRYRFTYNTLLALAGRKHHLPAQFMVDLSDELAELGWLLINLGTDFAVLSLSTQDTWLKLGLSRTQPYLTMSADEIESAFHRLCPTEEIQDDSTQ